MENRAILVNVFFKKEVESLATRRVSFFMSMDIDKTHYEMSIFSLALHKLLKFLPSENLSDDAVETVNYLILDEHYEYVDINEISLKNSANKVRFKHAFTEQSNQADFTVAEDLKSSSGNALVKWNDTFDLTPLFLLIEQATGKRQVLRYKTPKEVLTKICYPKIYDTLLSSKTINIFRIQEKFGNSPHNEIWWLYVFSKSDNNWATEFKVFSDDKNYNTSDIVQNGTYDKIIDINNRIFFAKDIDPKSLHLIFTNEKDANPNDNANNKGSNLDFDLNTVQNKIRTLAFLDKPDRKNEIQQLLKSYDFTFNELTKKIKEILEALLNEINETPQTQPKPKASNRVTPKVKLEAELESYEPSVKPQSQIIVEDDDDEDDDEDFLAMIDEL